MEYAAASEVLRHEIGFFFQTPRWVFVTVSDVAGRSELEEDGFVLALGF